ncbi:MAG TPA: histidine phosphatase family protein [Candidatus Limnocylindria bacterium]|nr:histidine phosphatase family protein [Candidatus Limnocylindria bacterium]
MPVLDIRRHAERQDRADDHSALSAAGRAMCERLAADAPSYKLVVSSPLPRAKETAERIAGRLDAVEPGLLPDLGSHAAQLFGEMRTLADWARLLRDDPEARTFADGQLPTWSRLAARVGEKDRILAVSHGGIIELPAILLMTKLGVAVSGPSFGYGDGVRITYRSGTATSLELLRASG